MRDIIWLVEEGNGWYFYHFDNEHDANVFREALWNRLNEQGRPTSVTVHRSYKPSQGSLNHLGIAQITRMRLGFSK